MWLGEQSIEAPWAIFTKGSAAMYVNLSEAIGNLRRGQQIIPPIQPLIQGDHHAHNATGHSAKNLNPEDGDAEIQESRDQIIDGRPRQG